jgi:hypothetical protein
MTNGENSEEGRTEAERRLRKATQRTELDSDALRRAHEDAQFVLEKTFQMWSHHSEKAFRLIRLNAIVLTILIAVSSLVPVARYRNVATVTSLLFFIGSALLALVGYRPPNAIYGLHPNVFEKLTEYKLREGEYLNWILTLGYSAWIAEDIRRLSRNERWIRLSLIAFLIGVLTLLTGIVVATYQMPIE